MTITDYTLIKCTWSGTIGTEEIFSYTRHILDLEDVSGAVLIDELSTSVTDMLATSVTGSVSISGLDELFPAHVHWTQLKLAHIDRLTGHYTDPDAVWTAELADVGAGVSADGLPYQSAHAITTRSDHSKSQRSRNRFYLPTPVWRAYDGHGRMQQPVIDAILLWMSLGQTSAIAAANSYAFVNYSPADHLPKLIEDVYLGDVIDTQRRRRNSEPEVRTVQALDQPTITGG